MSLNTESASGKPASGKTPKKNKVSTTKRMASLHPPHVPDLILKKLDPNPEDTFSLRFSRKMVEICAAKNSDYTHQRMKSHNWPGKADRIRSLQNAGVETVCWQGYRISSQARRLHDCNSSQKLRELSRASVNRHIIATGWARMEKSRKFQKPLDSKRFHWLIHVKDV
jgi:hypothetical protein